MNRFVISRMAGLQATVPSTQWENGQRFPTLRFCSYPWWSRLYRGIRFLPEAFNAIGRRRLSPTYSFHLVNTHDRPIGVSAGDIRYPASEKDLERFQPLVIRLEDRRFYLHRGIDFRGIARAAVANFRRLRIVQGGSTITQQVVRNTLLVSERSILRKLFEILLALKLEKHYSKHEILNLYCAHVYMGQGIRGFSAASKIIFRRKLESLDDTQVHGLVGLLRSPTSTFPEGDGAKFASRQLKVSKILVGGRGNAGRCGLKPNPISIVGHRCPRFTQIVRSELVSRLGCMPHDLKRVGLTIDGVVQEALSASLREIAKRPEVKTVAGIAVSISTGDVLGEMAYTAGRIAQRSPAYFGAIQPGSTFKTFALLSALEQGISLDDLLLSAPFESALYKASGNKPWRVRNYADQYRGLLSVREAFKFSDNVAFARLAEQLEETRLYKVYSDFGLSVNADASPAIVLGGHKSGVNLLSLVAAYRAIANGGQYARPRIVRYAEFSDSSVEWISRADAKQLPFGFRALHDLQLALREASPFVDSTKYPGKTGTTRTGNLFAGYDDEMAAAIWVEYERPMQEGDPKAVGAVSGFKKLMNRLLGYRTDLLSI